MEVKNVQVSDSLEGIARVGVVFLKQVSNGPVSSALRQRIEGLADELRGTLAGRKLSDVDSVARTRKLYRAIGIDPTRDRPSSEKLLRRVVRGKPLPKVSKLVDAVNYVSLRNQCPMGVYDWDRIVPPVLVRIGQPGEGYPGVSAAPPSPEGGPERNWVNLHGRFTLVDGEGPFGCPSHDSARTQISLGTVRAMIITWAPAEAPRSFVEGVNAEAAELCTEYAGSRVASSFVL